MITIQKIKELIREETEKLNNIGLFPVPVKEVGIVKSKSFYADAWRSQNRIRVSLYYLDAPLDEIRATIMHELCHMVPESGIGHGAEWKSIAAKVNNKYPEYNIKRVGSNLRNSTSSFNLRLASFVGSSKHIVVCNCCGLEFVRLRESNLTLHPERYTCKCGGSLKRVC